MPVLVKDDVIDAPPEGKSQTSHRKFINGDLPVGCERGNKWRRVFIPTYIAYVTGYMDAWFVEDDDAIAAMQVIWEVTYLNTNLSKHSIQVNDAVSQL